MTSIFPSKLRGSLFWRISGSLLLILIVLGVAYVSITAYSARKYFMETTQRLNASVAEEMLHEVNPFENGEINAEAVGTIMHSMMAVNPSLEVYLLDTEGNILKYVVLDKKVRLKAVDLDPVRQFIHTGGKEFITGEDPRHPGGATVFSAAEVREDGQLMGYVYMVLASEKYEHISEALLGSYFLRLGTQAFVITLVAAFLLGLLLIAMLTSNLRKIIRTVKSFENGDYQARIPVRGTGELSRLSRTFNQMADTILQNIEELREVDQLRRELIANVSHDLRSPLAVIHGYIETMVMFDDRLTPEQRKNYYEIIQRSSEKLKKLVADLFELSKLEARQVELNREAFNINELLNDSAREYQLLAGKKDIEIRSNLMDSEMVVADIALIQRVVHNLLDNAVKYSDKGSVVELNAEEEEGVVMVSVVNQGREIPEAELPHLFDRYYRKESSHGESTGLGLAIVKKIMDIHNGRIEVESGREGRTVFRFMIPAA